MKTVKSLYGISRSTSLSSPLLSPLKPQVDLIMTSITLEVVDKTNSILNRDNNNKSQERQPWFGTQRSQLSSWWPTMMIKTLHFTFGIWETQTTQSLPSLISITMVFYLLRGVSLTQIWLFHQLKILEQLLLTSRLENRFLNSQLKLNTRSFHGQSLCQERLLLWILKEILQYYLSYQKAYYHNPNRLSVFL